MILPPMAAWIGICRWKRWGEDQLLHLLDHGAAARFSARLRWTSIDQGVDRLGVDQDAHLDQVADLVVGQLVVERGGAFRDRLPSRS